MAPFDYIKPPTIATSIPYPIEMFGENQRKLKEIKVVIVDLLQKIASMLVDDKVVGNNLENFVFEFTKEYNGEGQRVYGNNTQDIRDFFMCIKERRNQYRMFFHKHIRLISDYKTNGIPHSYICCDSSINRLRHDWIIDVEENPIHICAILSLYNTLNGVSKIVYIGCETTNLHKAHITNRGIDSPFPVVHYHRARSPISHKTELVFRANMVDNIMQPAFIIPIRRNDPTENLFEKRFFNVPFEFLMRDGFDDMNFEKNIETAVSTDAHARKYLNSDKETRKKLYQILLNSLQKNSNVPQKSKKRKLNNEQNDADASAQKKSK